MDQELSVDPVNLPDYTDYMIYKLKEILSGLRVLPDP